MKAKDKKTTLLASLEARFTANMARHRGVTWAAVLARLEADAAALKALDAMESSGGEPDVVGKADGSGRVTFVDCSAESPTARRSLCFDKTARTTRKEAAPKSSALEMAASMGVELLTEEEYRALQTVGELDLKTSSWVATPADIRTLGGALFCDRRYDKVFVYHNGAQSYYAARGFRASLKV